MKSVQLLFASLLLLLGTTAQAQIKQFSTHTPARSVGSAGLGRSHAAGGNALVLNPGALGISSQYVVGAVYGMQKSKDADGNDNYAHVMGGEWTDSTPNKFNLAMGLAYYHAIHDGEGKNNLHMGLAYTYRGPTISLGFGLGGHWGQDLLVDEFERTDDFYSLDAGLALSVANQLMLGLVGYNVYNNDMENQPMGLGGGLSYWNGSFVLGFDTVAMFNAPDGTGAEQDVLMSYIVGAQYMVMPGLFLRASYRHDSDEKTVDGSDAANSIAGGITYVIGQRLGIELGYQQNVDTPEDLVFGATLELYNPFNR